MTDLKSEFNDSVSNNKSEKDLRKLSYSYLDLVLGLVLVFLKITTIYIIYNSTLAFQFGFVLTYPTIIALFFIKQLVTFKLDYKEDDKLENKSINDFITRIRKKNIYIVFIIIIYLSYYFIY